MSTTIIGDGLKNKSKTSSDRRKSRSSSPRVIVYKVSVLGSMEEKVYEQSIMV